MKTAITRSFWPPLVAARPCVLVPVSVVAALLGCACRIPPPRAVRAFPVAKGDYVRSVAFDTSGRFLAVITRDGLSVWDAIAARSIDLPPPSLDAATAVAFCPTAPLLVVATRDEQVSVRTVEGWEHHLSFPVERPAPYWNDPLGRRSIFGVAFAPDGSRVIAGTADGDVYMWDAQDGHLIRRFKAHLTGVNAIAVDPHGEWMITAGRGVADRRLRAWDLNTGSEITGFFPPGTEATPPGATQIRVSPDGCVYALLGGELWAWEAAGSVTRRAVKVPCDVGRYVTSVAMDPVGRYIATGHSDGTIAIRDVRSRLVVMEFDAHSCDGAPEAPGPLVSALAWAPSGAWIASGSTDGFVRLWQIHR